MFPTCYWKEVIICCVWFFSLLLQCWITSPNTNIILPQSWTVPWTEVSWIHVGPRVALNTRTTLALQSFRINLINSIVRKQCLLDYPFICRSPWRYCSATDDCLFWPKNLFQFFFNSEWCQQKYIMFYYKLIVIKHQFIHCTASVFQNQKLCTVHAECSPFLSYTKTILQI